MPETFIRPAPSSGPANTPMARRTGSLRHRVSGIRMAMAVSRVVAGGGAQLLVPVEDVRDRDHGAGRAAPLDVDVGLHHAMEGQPEVAGAAELGRHVGVEGPLAAGRAVPDGAVAAAHGARREVPEGQVVAAGEGLPEDGRAGEMLGSVVRKLGKGGCGPG